MNRFVITTLFLMILLASCTHERFDVYYEKGERLFTIPALKNSNLNKCENPEFHHIVHRIKRFYGKDSILVYRGDTMILWGNLKDNHLKLYNYHGKLTVESWYSNGVLSGISKMYYVQSGNIAYVEYENGMKNGISLQTNNNGFPLTFAKQVNGKSHGELFEYYANGNLKNTLNMKEGTANGDAFYYYDTTMIRMKGRFINGKITGVLTSYDKDGSIISRVDVDTLDL